MISLENGKDQRRQIARNLAKAKLSSSPVGSTASGTQLHDVITSLSSEALRRVSHREGSSGRPERITEALSEFMMSVKLEAPEEAKACNKRKVVKRKVAWNPSARVGDVKEGLSAMGRLLVSDEISEEESPESRSGQQASVGISFQGSGGGGRIQMSLSYRAGSENSGSEKPKIVGGEALHKLMKNGMVADGLSSLINGGFQGATGKQVRELAVRTNGTGRQRVLSIKSAGALDSNTSTLGSFQMMENKPIIRKATDSQGLRKTKPPARIFRGFLGK